MPHRSHCPFAARLALPTLCALLAPSAVAAPWLTFSEVSYRPTPGNEALEFVEIYNLEAPQVDLGGWRLEGEVTFEFRHGTSVDPRQCLVVARDLAAFRRRYPDVANVVGPFVGRLDNDGGRLTLHNRSGARVARMRYGRDDEWSAVADGSGHTLVLADSFLDPLSPRSWKPSPSRGGSPGTFEQTFRRVPGKVLVEAGEEWRFHRGSSPPPRGWEAPGLDDTTWERGKAGFGYGDDDDATRLADMDGVYLSVFTRREFVVQELSTLSTLTLLVDYDDGFVAYLNGEEVARSNMGRPGDEVIWDEPARGDHEAGRLAEFPIGSAASRLKKGENLLAVAGFNSNLDSSDFSLDVALEAHIQDTPAKTRRAVPVKLNEALLSRRDDSSELRWIELHNPTAATATLDDLVVSDDPARPARWTIPDGTRIAAHGFTVLSREQLGVTGSVGGTLFLSSAGGERIVDALSVRVATTTPHGVEISRGRSPDGARGSNVLARGTPGAANELIAERGIVVNEVSYHPIADLAAEEFIELHNPGTKTVSLAGLRLRSAVRHDFDAGDTITPGGFLVVAKDPKALAATHGLDPKTIVGPFEGRLANGGETIRISDSSGRTVDRVSFSDARPWPELADGRGSSLELVDPRIDNDLGAAWSASDESRRGKWQDVSYKAGVYLFRNMPASSFQLMLLDAGECLIDDIKVVDRDGETVVADDFSAPTSRWRAFGTHRGSGIARDPALSDSPCYRIVATGRGNSRHNYVSLDLSPQLVEKAKYTVSFRARRLRGSALLLSRTSGQGLAKMHRLAVPGPRGTPGRRNSCAAISAPVVGPPRQDPVAPGSEQEVRIEVTISSRDKTTAAEVRYRHESSSEWKIAALEHRSGRLWTGSIPPQPGGRVEFAITARDAGGREGSFPVEGTARPAQYAVDLRVEPAFPTYTVLVTDAEWNAARERQRMSNHLMDATLVHGKSRIFYNVGFRVRGSGFTRGGRNWRVVFGAESLDGRSKLTFDGQANDSAKMNERSVFWLLDQVDVPTPRQRYVHVKIHGQQQESGLYEEVEKVDNDFLANWFPVDPSKPALPGRLHKIDDYWDFRPPAEARLDDRSGGGRFGGFRFGGRGGSYVEAYLEYSTSDPEDYRWNFPPRANGHDESFEPLIELIRLADPEVTKTEDFLARVESLVDVDQWTRLLAGRTLANDWDSYGLSRGKNAYLYRAPDGLWRLLPWDSDLSWGGRGGFGGFRRGSSIYPEKFPAVRRLLSVPRYRRLFLGHVAFLARKRLNDPTFSRMIDELENQVDTRSRLRDAAADNADRILQGIPEVDLAVDRIERPERDTRPDLVRLGGTAPALAHRFRLGPHDGESQFPDERRWTADFELAGERGGLTLEALDRDGEVVATIEVALPE